MKRIFIANKIELSESFLNKFEIFSNKCNKYFQINWIKKENIHLTVKFIGEINDEVLLKIEKKLDDKHKSFESFESKINKIGIFGSKYNPKIVWMGLDNEEKFKELHYNIENTLFKFKGNEQPFVPHITLGRIKYIDDKKLFHQFFDEFKEIELNEKPFLINKFHIFESELTKNGPIYTIIKTYNF